MKENKYPCVDVLKRMGIQSLNELKSLVRHKRYLDNRVVKSYAQIASEPEFKGMSATTIWRLDLHGKLPPVWKKRLGISTYPRRNRITINLDNVDSAVESIIAHAPSINFVDSLALKLIIKSVERRKRWAKEQQYNIAIVQ